jgi:hypothetical protein
MRRTFLRAGELTVTSLWHRRCNSNKALSSGRVKSSARTPLQVGFDRRPVLRAAQAACKDASGAAAILAAAKTDKAGTAGELFYALLYAALYHEAQQEPDECKHALLQALQTEYARKSRDYMASVALVHAKRRGWAADG